MRLFDLQVLHELRAQTSLSTGDIAEQLHRTIGETRTGLGRMVEQGMIEQRGAGRGRVYHLSAAVFRAVDKSPAYVRVRGADIIQQERMVLQYIESFGSITRAQASELCMVTPQQASTLLRRMTRADKLVLVGERKSARYVASTEQRG